jgi:peptidoglycan lytic transglycosylase
VLSPLSVVTAASAPLAAPHDTALEVRTSRLNVLEDARASVTGTVLENHHAAGSGRLVALQALGRRGWSTITTTDTGPDGRFRLAFAARRLGSRVIRLRVGATPTAKAARRRLGRLNVYRVAEASWYGGGGSLACGGELTSNTLGVANRTLPCGTIVTLHYAGHTVRVPVVDRGPYVAGREFDLTEATKRALGFGDLGEVWSTN